MNRYRNAPSVRGPTKATASTLCQKCLKRGHYSYECKVTAQERPYLARPSRTQQLQNPKLRPELTTEVPDDNLRTKGTADALLAQREEERGRKRQLDESHSLDNRGQPSKRTRSLSSDSASSVSTISTNRSRSRSPRRARYDDRAGEARHRSQTPPRSWAKKRRHSDASSAYSASSYSSRERSRSRSPERNTRRRRRESSPKERGRSREISPDGSRADRSRSQRTDRARAARRRRSRTDEGGDYDRHHAKQSSSKNQVGASHHQRGGAVPPPRRERSLSPFSKRVALTQAMNMDR
ncbi:zinc knuckle-domain-containing protein [Aspergillus unguis]